MENIRYDSGKTTKEHWTTDKYHSIIEALMKVIDIEKKQKLAPFWQFLASVFIFYFVIPLLFRSNKTFFLWMLEKTMIKNKIRIPMLIWTNGSENVCKDLYLFTEPSEIITLDCLFLLKTKTNRIFNKFYTMITRKEPPVLSINNSTGFKLKAVCHRIFNIKFKNFCRKLKKITGNFT